jgi:hypothetical protein
MNYHMALVGYNIIEELLNFSILKMKTSDVKSFLEQSHSKFCLNHIITHNNLD